MFERALFLALWGVCASALAPLAIPADDDCALYLTGPGRSSAYDYSLNLLKGNFGYDGQQTCITYDAINKAYLDARNRILVAQPKGDWKPEDFASVGELVLDISIQLARTYGLTYEEIEKGLPLIDTSRTLIREVCPPVFSHVECRAGKYRRLDGLCNNLQHPTWGATMAPFQRLIGPLFADGINAPRISHTGRDLPLSRVVSRTMHPDDGFHDHAGTVMVIAWGQFMDHDYTLTGTPLDPVHRNDPEECCKRPPHLKHPYCNEIRIPEDDYFYRLFGVKCMDFVRGFPSPRPGCRLGSRIPFNTLTGVIDGNTVYGVTDKFARKLRTGYGGLLRMNPVFKEYGLKDLLPLKLDIPDEGCTRPNKNMYCFEAGEIRVNEQLVLTVMHTLMAREHNRVAEALAAVNPHWDDETLFQEARRINIAEIQHITYNEFLPILLGKDVMEKFGLVLEKQGYWNGYDQEVNPDVLASFAAAAYRFGHSLLPTAVERWSKAHKFIASKRLSDLIRRPYDLYRAGVLDEYLMGLMNQVAQAMDDSITQEVTNHLFKKVGARFGMDLVSLNMQRGREFGLPGYMEFRKFCGLSGAETFEELFGSMPNETVRKYETIFEHPIDVDLWSGGVSERPLPGSMLGPTFACIIATQFSYSRRGDRFWFELPNQPSSFTPEQLSEIRKSRLARIICDNTDIIDTVQLYPMVLPDHELNPRVPCRSGIIPQIDFSKWADPVPFHGAAKQFVTDAIVTEKDNKNDILVKELRDKYNAREKSDNETVSNNTVLDKAHDNVNGTETTTPVLTNLLNIEKFESDKNNSSQVIEATTNTNINRTKADKDSKYLNNKDKTSTLHKSKGHFRNQLKRRRRTLNASDNVEPLAGEKILPIIVDYVTSHQAKDREELLTPATQTQNFIKNSALADFNIETTHSTNSRPTNHVQPSAFKKLNKEDYDGRTPGTDKEKDIQKTHNLKEADGRDYRLSLKNRGIAKQKEEKNDNINNELERQGSYDISESTESSENLEDPNSSEQDETSREDRSHENIRYDPVVNDKNSYKVNDSSAEYSKELNEENSEEFDDFRKEKADSKEFIKKEQSDSDGEYFAKDSKNDKIKEKKGLPEESKEDYISEESNESLKDAKSQDGENNNENEKQIHINDEEVKPVVELNNESDESSEENSDIDIHLRNKLESLSDADDRMGKENEKITARSDNLVKVDVKQQFERIPLNYNHAKKLKPKVNNFSKTLNHQPETEVSEEDKEGTLDTLSPEDHKYDDNLNIKFHDSPIKLPEIKLPEDIINFSYGKSIYDDYDDQNDKRAQNQKDVQYDDKYSNENKNNKNDDEQDDSYEYYGKGDHNNDEDKKSKIIDKEQDHEDLYDKFVRERFGKTSFKKRSEKLKDDSKEQNPQLHNRIKNILKKTVNIHKEAEKSGDPNANYAWTLEYGEKL